MHHPLADRIAPAEGGLEHRTENRGACRPAELGMAGPKDHDGGPFDPSRPSDDVAEVRGAAGRGRSKTGREYRSFEADRLNRTIDLPFEKHGARRIGDRRLGRRVSRGAGKHGGGKKGDGRGRSPGPAAGPMSERHPFQSVLQIAGGLLNLIAAMAGWRLSRYSDRSDSTGLTRAARQAGITEAAIPAPSKDTTATLKLTGSAGET